MRTHVGAALLGAVLLIAPSIGEMLPVHHPCPDNVPRQVCFGGEHFRPTPTVKWGRMELELAPTKEYVQSLLQTCLRVEHSTIPLYLTTMYSIVNQTSFEAKTMRSVVMEEMLHMTNAANVLNAIGGHPDIDSPDFIPKYPLVLPVLNMSADVVWFTFESMQHYQILESTPPGGYSQSISAAYLHVVELLNELVNQHGEPAVFSGDHSLQVEATTSYGQVANKVFNLANATGALLGTADQGGGCPVSGKSWPETSSIAAGHLGGNFSHSARYQEILDGRSYRASDTVGNETGEFHNVSWHNVRRFAPNPSTMDFWPEQCVDGGSWVVRNSSFFVHRVWLDHNKTLAETTETSWEACAAKCVNWTINDNQPLQPCAMWSWNADGENVQSGVKPHSCLLAQGGGPVTSAQFDAPNIQSGCLFGTVCNHSLPGVGGKSGVAPPPPSPGLLAKCNTLHVRGEEFASNYTALLVQLHDVFNGNPDGLGMTIGGMMALKQMAIDLMETDDPRIPGGTMGVGPPWQYIRNASKWEERRRKAWPRAGAGSAPSYLAGSASLHPSVGAASVPK